MLIKDMFKSDINRNINGVIKVQQDDEKSIEQELREYVITKELNRHFSTFLDTYAESLDYPSDKVGVWISGFFGSGKSHFLKILSYLLDNREIAGRKAIEYFSEKFKDPMMFSQLERCANVNTKTLLFNIDSKSDSKEEANAILRVFSKVFYDSLGYFGQDYKIVKLEKYLVSKGYYEDFKKNIEQINGDIWEEVRKIAEFMEDDIVSALVKTTGMSEESARNWFDNRTSDNLSIEDFVIDVNEYVSSQEGDFRLLFMVDEIGQYIGDNGKLMLNLQTLVEELGSKCNGKAWVVVTSQEAIDKITKISGDDFSKIQGRFNTRLSLSSSSVDEVIKKRILEKTEHAQDELRLIYDNNSAVLKNLFAFNDAVMDIRGYSNENDFIDTYPFVPYQFKLMQDVLTQIRQHGNSGKHLSEGERSMLSGFQEVAQKNQNNDSKSLVPFSDFYDTIYKSLDSTITRVINRSQDAADNEHGLEQYDVRILKLLYLIRYVDGIPSTLENISTLMNANIDTDKIEQKNNIKESLERLIKQNYISRSGERYLFLTDDEQDISKEIKNTQVENTKIINQIGNTIFGDIFTIKKINYSDSLFAFDTYVDDSLRGQASGEIKLKIITELSDDYGLSRESYLAKSGSETSALVVLSRGFNYYEEILQSEKIDAYVAKVQTKQLSDHVKSIINNRRLEGNVLKTNYKNLLEEAIINADFYIFGDEIQIKGSSAKDKLQYAMEYLIKSVYNKFNLIVKDVKTEEDIQNILSDDGQLSIGLEEVNNEALEEVYDYIKNSSIYNRKLTLSNIQRRFHSIPFGWSDMNVSGLIALLLKRRKIILKYKANIISISDNNIISLLTNYRIKQDVYVEIKEEIDSKIVNSVRMMIKEYFDIIDVPTEADDLYEFSKEKFENERIKFININKIIEQNSRYPGKQVISQGIEIFNKMSDASKDSGIYLNTLNELDEDLLDLQEDFDRINNFYEKQKPIFDKADRLYRKLSSSTEKSYFDNNEEAINSLTRIESILESENPYSNISELPGLQQKLESIHQSILDEKKENIKNTLISARGQVFAQATEKEHETLKNNASNVFADIQDSLVKSNSLTELDAIENQIRNKKDYYLRELPKIIQKVSSKKVSSISKSELVDSKIIKNKDDIDEYLNTIKERLLQKLEDQDELRIV